MIKKTFPFLAGCIVTLVFVYIYVVLIQRLGAARSGADSNPVVARVEKESLRQNQLSERASLKLVPAKEEERRILYAEAEEWIDERLLELEARAQKISSDELLKREVEAKVLVAPEKLQEDYERNQSVYGVPFPEAEPLIQKKLRDKELRTQKKIYLRALRKKYKFSIHLPAPKPPDFPGYVREKNRALNPPPAKAEAKPVLDQKPKIVIFSDLEGKPSQGPADAAITLIEFSDFHCPFCQKVSPVLEELVKAYPGKIRRIWRHYPLPFHQGAEKTHEASECAAEQGKFWEYRDKIFQNQARLKEEGILKTLAKESGLDQAKFDECLGSGRSAAKVKTDIESGKGLGISGTPNVFLNGILVGGAYPLESFKSLVNHLLDPAKVPLPDFVKPVPVPKEETLKAHHFDDLDGKPSAGPADAKVTIVEFSDFHCPYCAKSAPTIEQLMKKYEGKIRRIWRHYPLPFHQSAEKTHEASECAAEQGKFWPFHDQIFQNQARLSQPNILTELAQKSGLDEKRFAECTAASKYAAKVKADVDKGKAIGVQGTPTFFINDQPIVGARPYEQFEELVKKSLN